MSKLFFTLAFAIGLAVVAWIGAGFVGSDLLALAFTGLIGAVYCLGFGELVNFRRQTHELNAQVHQLPESQEQVNHWLGTLPAPMQFPVQRRIEGHAAALPGPQLTPYLTGLLVMLGLGVRFEAQRALVRPLASRAVLARTCCITRYIKKEHKLLIPNSVTLGCVVALVLLKIVWYL